MGLVHTEITLRNASDADKAAEGLIQESEIRQTTVRAMVDTGAGTLVINEELREQLGLKIKGFRRATLANDAKEMCKVTYPVEILWNERYTTVSALVMSNTTEILLGAIPLEDMDLVVDPARQTLIGAHGDEVVTLVM
ncbi:MAG: retroviral-like aspartic protease family protein [Treponema sp.]|nr:retroviral-like aspartic protease family protein [Treponema sp.]